MTYTTLKLKHDPRGDVDAFTARRKQYSSLFRILYNKLVDNPSLKYDDAVKIVSTYNNLELNDSYLRNAAFQDAKAEYDSDIKKDNKGHKVIFGGKDNFIARRKNLITKEEYKESRLRPLYVIGEANKGGNGRFKIRNRRYIDYYENGEVLFSFRIKDKRSRMLAILKKKQDNKELAITYKADSEYIYISFEEQLDLDLNRLVIPNRYMAIDLNPEYIGIVIFDVINGKRKLVASDNFDMSEIIKRHIDSKSASDSEESKYWNNKRKYELKEVNKRIFNMACHFGCSYIVIEKLHFKNSKGRKCTVQWNKRLTIEYLMSRCYVKGFTKLLQVNPAFTSIIGNIICKHYIPDMCRSAYEIGYRGVKGIQNGNFNDEGVDNTNYPHSLDEIKLFIIKSLEESGNKDKIEEVNKFTEYKEASRFLYGNKIKFRTSIEDCRNNETVKVFKNEKSLVKERSYHVRRCKKTVVWFEVYFGRIILGQVKMP